MSTTAVYESAIDTARDVGETLLAAGLAAGREVGNSFDASHLVPSHVLPGWTDDALERVVDEGRRIGVRRLLIAGGAIAVVAAIVVAMKRRRTDDRASLRVADDDRATSAA